MVRSSRTTRKLEAGKSKAARVTVSGKNIAISASLKAAVEKRMRASAQRTLGASHRASVTVS
ncbi:MAG TPA: hypothetical protein VD713_00315, partial [Sphingomonadales bacterium]|nr:hypothetical protein [Sphingomonadales bacterium]